MSSIQPIKTNSFIETKEFLKPKEQTTDSSIQAVQGQSLKLTQDVTKTENSLAKVDVAKKGETAVFSIVGMPIRHIAMAQDHLINPLTLLEDFGISVDDRLEAVTNTVLNIELVLRAFRGISVGSLLIFKYQHLKEAKNFHKILKEKSEQMAPESSQAKQMAAYLKALDEKIKLEEIALKHASTKYAVTVSGYLPTAAYTAWNLIEATSPAVTTYLIAGGVLASTGIHYYEKHKAEKGLSLHTKWKQDVQALAEKHAKAIPEKLDETLAKRTELKSRLKELTLKKHKTISDFLKFDVIKKNIQFYGSAILSAAIIAAMVTGLFISVGLLIAFPQLALLALTVGLIAAGIGYWAANRPNLFKALILTSVKSLYYSMGNAIDAWKLQHAKVKLLELNSQRITLFANQMRQGKKIDVAEIEKFNEEHDKLKKRVETLEDNVKYWAEKQQEVHVRLFNAELADLNRLEPKKALDLTTLVADVKSLYKYLTDQDKTELKDVVGLDLEKLDKEPTDSAIKERLLSSYLGTREDEHIKDLRTKQELLSHP